MVSILTPETHILEIIPGDYPIEDMDIIWNLSNKVMIQLILEIPLIPN